MNPSVTSGNGKGIIIILDVDPDLVSRLDAPGDDFHRQFVDYLLLDDPLDGPRAQLDRVSFPGQLLAGLVG
jgi:hypothetical protein